MKQKHTIEFECEDWAARGIGSVVGYLVQLAEDGIARDILGVPKEWNLADKVTGSIDEYFGSNGEIKNPEAHHLMHVVFSPEILFPVQTKER